MTTTKITNLTGLNTRAIEQAIAEGHLSPEVKVTKTTATFPTDAATAHADLLAAKNALAATHGSRQHPVASIHAAIRKAAKAASN